MLAVCLNFKDMFAEKIKDRNIDWNFYKTFTVRHKKNKKTRTVCQSEASQWTSIGTEKLRVISQSWMHILQNLMCKISQKFFTEF